MNDIQIDMYPVGLGSAMLLQFSDQGRDRVRVLADGGVGRGKNRNTVRDELLSDPLLCGGEKNLRLDLIVGTHYDADHLEGLVPVIMEDCFEIGEVWLPPVVDDAASTPLNEEPISNTKMLAHLFYDDADEGNQLQRYLNQKMEMCQELTHAVKDHAWTNTTDDAFISEVDSNFRELRQCLVNDNRSEMYARIDQAFRQIEICTARHLDRQMKSRDKAPANEPTWGHGNAGADDQLQLGHGDETWPYPRLAGTKRILRTHKVIFIMQN